MEGHPEGADRLINFKFTTYYYNGATNIRLRVQASGPVSGASYLGPFNSETIARYSWSTFSKNLQNRINNASTTYITSDKFTPPAQSFRAISPQLTPSSPLDPGGEVDVIDPANVDTSRITNKVPLFPVGTDDAELEEYLRTANPSSISIPEESRRIETGPQDNNGGGLENLENEESGTRGIENDEVITEAPNESAQELMNP